MTNKSIDTVKPLFRIGNLIIGKVIKGYVPTFMNQAHQVNPWPKPIQQNSNIIYKEIKP